MLKIFYGDDRARIQNAVERFLSDGYEKIDAEQLTRGDMDTLFYGTSLFGETRQILLKGLDENKECWKALPEYLDTPHKVVLWVTSKPNAREAVGKALVEHKIEQKEFKQPDEVDPFEAFNIYDVAVRGDAKSALKMCVKLERSRDPYSVLGAFSSKAMTALERRERRAPKALKILAETDEAMKSSSLDGWTLLKAAIVKLANL